jgi:hypothetical protein
MIHGSLVTQPEQGVLAMQLEQVSLLVSIFKELTLDYIRRKMI